MPNKTKVVKLLFSQPWRKVLIPDRVNVLRAARDAARARGDEDHAERCERALAACEGGRP